jgi:hypothetical protein
LSTPIFQASCLGSGAFCAPGLRFSEVLLLPRLADEFFAMGFFALTQRVRGRVHASWNSDGMDWNMS